MNSHNTIASTNPLPGVAASLQAQYAGLVQRLHALAPLAIAFSGGLDSRFLAFTAARAGLAPLLVHAHGPHVPQHETLAAQEWATRHNLRLLQVYFTPLEAVDLANSGTQRCYHCKKTLFAVLQQALANAEAAGGAPGQGAYTLCDGTNASDIKTFRPGLKALQEAGIISPLAEAGLEKNSVRVLGQALGLEWAQQPATPCLLTRFPYGVVPSCSQLATLAEGEKQLAALLHPLLEPLGPEGGLRLRCPHAQPGGQEQPDAHGQAGDVPPLLVAELHTSVPLPAKWEEKVRAALLPLGIALAGLVCQTALSGYYDIKSS
ncbi:asparagine synthase-related protein [Desulfovibrio cuneatus]|uniref:asparagine synthase-related protein n=1 Tax=Desulfovibrio cuneatus TaxID=159728 RepID=UPI0004235880|nr:asparagine synthase-related protein [Desulfovibrio cuneatus]